ncbi:MULTISPECIES: ATP-binding protein [Vibrio]|uniref:histidine kinase n=1 Tax=Vibrio halioticoli NBRC 102217 TaxID=1219072 RepID=V5FHF6_9VIBR|nr:MULTISPECIES: ATP-binding protein [Vibrio]MPW35546.1 two-component sensor histidine kinase [Vibrio sp. B1Z05]GAD89296.1 putative two-component histidine kinase [Vibrio halioticoli NBRC 102217]
MRKLIVSLVIAVLASIVILGWSISQYAQQHDSKVASVTTSERIQALRLAGSSFAQILDDQLGYPPTNLIDTWNEHNQEQLSLISEAQFPLPASLKAQFENDGQLLLQSDEGVSLHYRLPKTHQVLNIQTQLIPPEDQGLDLNKMYTALFYTGIVVILLLWVSPLIKQLLNLSKATKSFGMGNLQHRIKIQKSSYISEIEQEFNGMADRIQQLVDDNKLLSRAVSHDLKTPIARLRFGIEALEETDNEKLKLKYFSRLNHDLNSMEELVSTLLSYARLDQANIKPELEPIELNSWLQTKLASYSMDKHNLIFNPDADPIWVQSDPMYLSMQVGNLLSNAERFGQSTIKVQITTTEHTVILSVDDDGKGIDEQEAAQVIKPFVRGQQSRGNAGHGMGLAIVNRIGHWMGSPLTIHRSKELGGASMRLTFLINNNS